VDGQYIESLKICRRARGVSHLLFAENSLLFLKARGDHASRIKEIPNVYATSTGQLINPSKCSILFGEAYPVARRLEVKTALGVEQEMFETKYLGLPTPDGRMGW
jgi:hypothetical protein